MYNSLIRQNLIYDEPVNILALNPLSQLSSHDTNPTVPMRSFTLRFEYIVWKIRLVDICYTHREDVKTAENEYDIGPTKMNYTNEVSIYRSTL